jgi:hypothetical protein
MAVGLELREQAAQVITMTSVPAKTNPQCLRINSVN